MRPEVLVDPASIVISRNMEVFPLMCCVLGLNSTSYELTWSRTSANNSERGKALILKSYNIAGFMQACNDYALLHAVIWLVHSSKDCNVLNITLQEVTSYKYECEVKISGEMTYSSSSLVTIQGTYMYILCKNLRWEIICMLHS